jgi:hypothetical protein
VVGRGDGDGAVAAARRVAPNPRAKSSEEQ